MYLIINNYFSLMIMSLVSVIAGNQNNQYPGTFAPIDLPKPPVYTVSEDCPSAPPSYTSEPPRYEDAAESDRNTDPPHQHQQQHQQQ